MTQSSRKRDTKSRSHPGMKLAPVRVFSCKHPQFGGHLLCFKGCPLNGSYAAKFLFQFLLLKRFLYLFDFGPGSDL